MGTDRAGKVRQTLAESLTDAEIVGYVGDCDNDKETPYLGTPMQMEDIARAQHVTMIVLLPDAPIDEDIATELLHAKLHGQMIVDVRSFCEHIAYRLPVSQISSEWLLTEEGFSLNTRGSLRRVKRAFDLAAALGLLVITFPIMLLTALAIRVESPGPIIYRQRRVGLFGQDFTVYKFRSMRVNKDSDTMQATKNDPRKTKLGNFLRKSNIDELPQFINVLLGSMSVVGPRPHMLKHTEEYSKLVDKYMVRHLIKPGITGWAQINGFRGETKELWQMEGRVERDIWYLEHWTFMLDLYIIYKTVKNLIRGDKEAY